MADDGGREVWIKAGLVQLGQGGVDSVRVEVVAAGLGVTKGGFYRRFRDRQEFLEALLAAWSAGRIGAIEKQTTLDGAGVRDRLQSLVRLYSERHNAEAMGIELAVRQWARADPVAAGAAAKVDKARLENVARLYGALGLPAAEAHAQAFLFYAFLFGQSLLFVDQGGKKRADLLAACTTTLTAIEGAGSAAASSTRRRRGV
ncbi:MAG: TetR/AcrR family transcriptional regulator [Xanthobacteraceae bacterium]|nr:TetR/AcrR family transcriptional regulator [Xanthobacteraceae bacterium]